MSSGASAEPFQPINIMLLDDWVLEYLYFSEISLQSESDSASEARVSVPRKIATSQYNFTHHKEYLRQVRLIKKIRDCFCQGDIHGVLELLKENSPVLLQDSGIMFRLCKQQMIEYVRQGEKGTEKALAFIQKEFAPFALNAFPEAYEQFKSSLLVLLYQDKLQQASINKEWSLEERGILADQICASVLCQLRHQDATLCLVLKYLITIYRSYCKFNNPESPYISHLNAILKFDRSTVPLERETQAHFSDANIVCLANIMNIDRHEALLALKYTEGNLVDALKNELGRLQLDQIYLQQLLSEYCDILHIHADDDDSKKNQGRFRESQWLQLKQAKELMLQGNVDSVVSILKSIDANVFEKYPKLFFHLKFFEFYDIYKRGGAEEALTMMQTVLSPLSTNISSAEVNDAIRYGSLILAFHDLEHVPDSVVLHMNELTNAFTLAEKIVLVLSDHLRLSEPVFLSIMRYLVYIHDEWYRQQMHFDQFEEPLQIAKLKSTDITEVPKIEKLTDVAEINQSNTQSDKVKKIPMNEEHILTLMDVMAFSRVEAIGILNEYNNDLNAILQSLLP